MPVSNYSEIHTSTGAIRSEIQAWWDMRKRQKCVPCEEIRNGEEFHDRLWKPLGGKRWPEKVATSILYKDFCLFHGGSPATNYQSFANWLGQVTGLKPCRLSRRILGKVCPVRAHRFPPLP